MRQKEYYEAFLSVIEFITSGNNAITMDEGERIAGDYWPRIYHVLKEEKVGVTQLGGVFHITQPDNVKPLRADCRYALEEIAQYGADRDFEKFVKEFNMKYAKMAYNVSLASISIAAIALIWQIVSLIIPQK